MEKVNVELRTIKVTGRPLSVAGLIETATQFQDIGERFDSAAHEMAAIQLRWAARRIGDLEIAMGRIAHDAKMFETERS